MRGIPTGTAGNKRVYEKRVDGSTQEWFHYFGITGQRLARYSFTVSGAVITFAEHENSVWFGGKLVRNAGSWTNIDHQGSVGKYLPYGEDKPGASGNPANDGVKFAAYTRDAGTGIDYADQRWHLVGTGRFATADPYSASGGPSEPGSWNRFAYVQGDPIHYGDPTGLARLYCFQDSETEGYFCFVNSSGPGGGGGGGSDANMFSSEPTGKYRARMAMKVIQKGDFKSRKKCRDFLEQWSGKSGAELDKFMDRIVQSARDSEYELHDGASSLTRMDDPSRFPGVSVAPGTRVSDWFGETNTREGLSQPNGNSIWIQESVWGSSFGSQFTSWDGEATSYGVGTLFHELLHKQWLGGGNAETDHDNMTAALKASGNLLGKNNQNQISNSIGVACFK